MPYQLLCRAVRAATMTVSAEALRWAVNVSRWQPSPQQWSAALGCLPQQVRDKCLQYLQRDDQKRAIVSQLLQRACIQQLIGEQWQRIVIHRTKGNKPFYAGSLDRQHAPNFNYNVSHEVRCALPYSKLGLPLILKSCLSP